MILKFTKSAPYIPDPVRSRPLITDEDRTRAAETPPQVVPFHCKPWLDGQKTGWTLYYGYVTPISIVGLEDGKIQVENLATLAGETNQPRVVDQFAKGYFGIGTGYTLVTPPGYVSLILPGTHSPPGLEAVTGVIETDWYPRQLFLVFRAPAEGVRIHLDYKMELARVVAIPRQEDWKAEPMSEQEAADLRGREAEYLEEEYNTSTSWTAASGDSFTHLYKEWAKKTGSKHLDEN